MKLGKWAWFNGKIIKSEKVQIPIDCQAVQYGLGCFEGIRFYKTKDGRRAIFRLNDHLERLNHSMEHLRMRPPFSITQISSAIKETIIKNGLGEGYIRPWLGYTERRLGLTAAPAQVSAAVFVVDWPPYFADKKIELRVSPVIRPHPKSFPMTAKICGVYVNSFLAQNDAKKFGRAEAVLLTHDGCVAEASVANIFIVTDDNRLLTPQTGSILPGITRDSIIQLCRDESILKMSVDERPVFIFELWQGAKEIFLCGTAAEITSVEKFRSCPEGKTYQSKITEVIKKVYAATVRGELKQYEHWLTYVD